MTTLEWQDEFRRYQQFPEFQQRQSMTLSDFQYIYWWEYGHRMLGRVVGVAFCVPWLLLSIRGRIPPGYHPRLALLGTMGATQGAVGWWMVKSGLGDDRKGDKKEIRVKPVRLATHLSMAMATYAGLVWTAMDIFQLPNKKEMLNIGESHKALAFARRMRTGGFVLTGLAATTIVSGAFVAGNDAGRAFNSFPKMNDEWIPSEMWELHPWYKNLMENTATVQWNHRVLGTTTAITGITMAALAFRQPHLLTPQLCRAGKLAGAFTAAQFTLGVTTLLYYVPISLAAVHQLGSVAVLTSGLYLLHSAKYAVRPTIRRAVAHAAKPTTTGAAKVDVASR